MNPEKPYSRAWWEEMLRRAHSQCCYHEHFLSRVLTEREYDKQLKQRDRFSKLAAFCFFRAVLASN